MRQLCPVGGATQPLTGRAVHTCIKQCLSYITQNLYAELAVSSLAVAVTIPNIGILTTPLPIITASNHGAWQLMGSNYRASAVAASPVLATIEMSVCLSVTPWHCVKTRRTRITKSLLYALSTGAKINDLG